MYHFFVEQEQIGEGVIAVTGPDVNHINYQSHTPSKILDGAFVKSFIAVLKVLSIEI